LVVRGARYMIHDLYPAMVMNNGIGSNVLPCMWRLTDLHE
jgi:hypothetical protein